MNASSEREAGSITGTSERGEPVRNTAFFDNVSDRIFAFSELIMADDTRGNNPDELREVLLPGTHFDGQSHTHHSDAGTQNKNYREARSSFRLRMAKPTNYYGTTHIL